jgi:glycosyltransferase involved in cell wall biosynthesis
MMNGFRAADAVTCTTPILAKDLLSSGVKNVVVVPNAINPTEEQFIARPTESEILRFGWLGGSSHKYDVELMKSVPYPSQNFQLVLCGFDTRGKVTEVNQATGEKKERDIHPTETVWFAYEVFLTDGYDILANDQEYKEFLFKFKNESFAGEETKPYRRIFTKPVNSYAKGYDQFDVALAPLKDTKFNRYKSQLKIIEAGFKKKAVIASDYGPYQLDLVHGKNALLVGPNKNHKQWRQHVVKLTQNPSMVKELGEALYETVKDKYNLNTVNQLRVDLYKKLVNG